jgi:hypothetical protein
MQKNVNKHKGRNRNGVPFMNGNPCSIFKNECITADGPRNAHGKPQCKTGKYLNKKRDKTEPHYQKQ